MASESERRDKYQHNREFLDTIREERFADWAAVVAFYAAFQLIEALLDRKTTRDHSSHAARNRILQETRTFQHIWRNYKPLHDASIAARYIDREGVSYPRFEEWMPLQQVLDVLVRKHLTEVYNSVARQLGWAR